MITKDFSTFLKQVDCATRKNFNEFSEFFDGLTRTEKQCFTRDFIDYKNVDNPDFHLLDVGHECLKMVRVDAYNVNKKGKYVWGFISCIRIFMIGMVFIDIAVNYGDVIYLANCAKSVSAFFQGVSKAIPAFFNSDQMLYLRIATLTRFWAKSQNIVGTKNYHLWRKLMNTYKYTAYVLIVLMIIASLLYDELLFPVYIPEYPFVLQIFQLCQYIEFISDLLLVVGTDLTFLACCAIIWRQSALLINEFALLDGTRGYNNTMKQFRKCVVHHDFLLDYVNQVISTFKIPLLLQYVVSVLGLCIDFYLLTENPTQIDMSKSIIYLGLLSSQIGMYCFVADKTCEMIDAVPKFLNKTQWYNNPLYLNKMFVMVLCRSQKEVQFTGGGMIKINKEGFTSIFKTTLSFYTLVRQMKDSQ